MPKAILELEMPESCWQCPCIQDRTETYRWCGAVGGDCPNPPYEKRRDDCPLKPVEKGGVTMLHVGNGNYVAIGKILAITLCESAPMRRKRMIAEDEDTLIDCTAGKKTRSLLHLVDGFVVSSSISPEALINRKGVKIAIHHSEQGQDSC